MTPIPPITFIGAGRLAHSLAVALQAQGLPVAAVASRNAEHAAALADRLGVPALTPVDAARAARWAFLTVSDDAIGLVAAALPWHAGQAVIHCSGATEVAVLAPAREAGAAIAGFHPLQLFAHPEHAASLLRGASVAIEAEEPLSAGLHRLAQRLGLHALSLPPGSRARYHAAAGYAASFLLPLLQEAAALWSTFGVDEATALQALLPLARGTLETVQARGVAASLSGPLSRGDLAVIRRQLADLATLGPAHVALYRDLALRQLPLGETSGRLDASQLAALRQLLT